MQPAISAAPTNAKLETFGQEHIELDELAHHQRRRTHLERQTEDVQHVGEQAGVVVLFELDVHPLLGGGHPTLLRPYVSPRPTPNRSAWFNLAVASRNSILLSSPGFGSSAAQVAHERVSVGGVRLDRTGFASSPLKNCSRFANRRFSRSASPSRRARKFAVALDAGAIHRFSIPLTIVVT